MNTNTSIPQELSDKFATFLTKTVLVGEEIGKGKAAEWLINNESEIGKWPQDQSEIDLVNAFFGNEAHDHAYRKAFYVRAVSLM